LKTHIITVHENLPVFEPLFMKKIVSKVSLIVPLNSPFEEDTESRVDTLVEYGTPVEIIARLHKKDVKNLKQLMNYFIYKGWPFLENFTCNLEPSPNEGCIFGHWYGDADFARALFEMNSVHPQTEFCSMQNWVGVNAIHSLIWAGKPSHPSSHFCEASRGLTVLMGDGSEIPCPHITSDEFQTENSECQVCMYALTCGGGCKLKLKARRCPPVKELIEASLEYYFGEFIKRINFYEQYHGGIQ
jgi:sulfatase maturation enzyme AslB (radical SAM superfamily)